MADKHISLYCFYYINVISVRKMTIEIDPCILVCIRHIQMVNYHILYPAM